MVTNNYRDCCLYRLSIIVNVNVGSLEDFFSPNAFIETSIPHEDSEPSLLSGQPHHRGEVVDVQLATEVCPQLAQFPVGHFHVPQAPCTHSLAPQ